MTDRDDNVTEPKRRTPATPSARTLRRAAKHWLSECGLTDNVSVAELLEAATEKEDG